MNSKIYSKIKAYIPWTHSWEERRWKYLLGKLTHDDIKEMMVIALQADDAMSCMLKDVRHQMSKSLDEQMDKYGQESKE